MIDIRKLKYFMHVAEEGNIGRAAVKLNISQPPLTRQIHQLEEDLGVKLFERTPKGMELNHAGELFLVEAKNILSLIEQATERTQKAGSGKLGRIDVAIFGTAILDVIPQVLLRYRDQNPDVKVVLHTLDKTEQINALRQRRISIGFNRLISPLPDISTEHFINDKLLLAVNENINHPINKTFDFKDLKNHSLIVYPPHGRPNFSDKVRELCESSGFMPSVVQEVDDAVTAVALVASGFGVCVVPECAATLKLPGVQYVNFKNAPKEAFVDLTCIFRSDDKSPILEGFLEVIREVKKLRKNADDSKPQ